MNKFKQMLEFQGVTETTAEKLCFGPDIWAVLKKSPNQTILKSFKSGYVENIAALIIGRACVGLGAGRSGKSSKIDTTVGVELLKSVNDFIEENEEWICVYHREQILDDEVKATLASALHLIQEQKTGSKSKISKILK